MPPLLEKNLAKTYALDRDRLKETKVPIVTVAGSFREDLKKMYGLPDDETTTDIVLSRAHFSMALGAATQAWGAKMDPEKAWMVDPTNYVSIKNWRNVQFTEYVGKTLARHPLLKLAKDFVDKFGRNKLPILNSITPPLLYLTEHVHNPILSFHIVAGNILAGQGKKVVQVVTDPHVRPEYVTNAGLPNTRYCVFDETTKLQFLEIAALQKIAVHPDKIIVTGPPVDPRIVAAREKKTSWRNGPLKICITTGGLGTNKPEIRQLLVQLLPHLRRSPAKFQVIVYAGTQSDIAEMVRELAHEEHVKIGENNDKSAHLRLLYHPQILDANELLIHFAFPWAHGFISKPSGDMAYDAVAAGCFLLTLKEWGVWEERIREIFEQKEIARRAEVEHIIEQLTALTSAKGGSSWVEHAMNHAFGIEKLFLLGNKKILEVVKTFREE
ncbi:hypothetical protein BH10PAT2_BH10PAT2_3150 [soil metagenome]